MLPLPAQHEWSRPSRGRKCGSDAFLSWSRNPDGYRNNDRMRAVVEPWFVLELCTVFALTQLGIRQSDWWRVGIRSTYLYIVVEYTVEVCEWILNFISLYDGYNYFSMRRLKLNHVSKRGPRLKLLFVIKES